MVDIKCYDAWADWCAKKSFANFKKVYTLTFHGGMPWYRTYKIIKNTISGRYKEIINDPDLIVDRKHGRIYKKF